MQMRMQREILSPCMQYGYHAWFSAKMFSVMSKTLHHAPCSCKKYVVHFLRRMHARTVQCFRQCKDHMKVTYRQQFCFSCSNPLFALRCLAFGTMPVAATIIRDTNMATVITAINMTTHCSSAASSHRIKRS